MKSYARATILSCCLLLLFAFPVSAQFGGGQESKLVHFHLTGPMKESPGMPNPFEMLMNPDKPKTFRELLDRFKKARDDSAVKAMILTVEDVSMGFAQLQELREAMAQFRAADKEIFVHAENMGTGLYVLFSAASQINMVPTGDLWLTGFFAESPYAKGLLEKLGVEADMLQYEAYKSAAEVVTRSGPSEPAAENMNWLLDSMYESAVGMIADSRQMSADKVRELIDNGPYSSERAREVGLIDTVEFRQDFIAGLKDRYAGAKIDKKYGEDDGPQLPENPFEMFSFFMNMIKGVTHESTAPAVAIVYVDGAIDTGSGGDPSPLSPGGEGAFSTPIRKALDKAAKDDSVKAVVLRVDSPGGSALASEIILNATKRVAAKKPLIVSMGNVAGSGGYYVACGSHAIFADDTTITASIGVVGGKLVTTGMWDKAGINWHEYKRGAMAGIMGTGSRFSDGERAKIRHYMEEVYEKFKGHVTECRGDKLAKPIGELAGGRVFTGKQALELGLVDKLGGLNDAIKYAAAQANIGEYEIRTIPRQKEPLEMLMEMMGGGPDDDDEEATTPRVRTSLFTADSPLLQNVLPVLRQLDPQRVDAVMRILQRLDLIHREGVITMMPQEFIIR